MKHMYLAICFFVCLSFSIDITAQEDVATTGLLNPVGIAIKDSNLFIGSVGNASIRKKDLLDTSTTNTTPFFQGVDFPAFITIHGNDLYIPLLGDNKVVKLDVTSATPVLINVVTNVTTPMGLAFRNDELYISLRTEMKVVKVDITQNNPIPVDVITQIPGTFVNGIAFYGDELYITHDGTISKTNVTDAVPTLTQVVANTGAINVAFGGDFLYFGQFGEKTVSRIDVSSAIVIPDTFLTLNEDPWGLVVAGNDLYVAEQIGGRVVRFDLTTLLSLEDTEKAQFSYYPNPTKDFLYVDNLKNNTSYILSDQHGRIIKKGTLANTIPLDLSTVANGIYFLRVGNFQAKKIVKY